MRRKGQFYKNPILLFVFLILFCDFHVKHAGSLQVQELGIKNVLEIAYDRFLKLEVGSRRIRRIGAGVPNP